MVAFTLSVHVEGTDWAAWATAIATAVTATILFATAMVAGFALRDAKRTRHGQLITDIWARYDEPEILASRREYPLHGPQGISDLIERLWSDDPTNDDIVLYDQLSRWPALIEMLGVLYDEKALTLDVIAKAWGIHIIDAWRVWEKPTKKLRTLAKTEVVFVYFELLSRDLAGLPPELTGRGAAEEERAEAT